MKTLYISDLDGTLFNKSKKISIFTADVINKCIEEGMLFSVATARMPYGCDYRLKDIHMTIPGILTNGVFLYDFKNEKYVSVENIGAEVAKQVVKIFKDVKLSCFVYIFTQDKINVYYDTKSMEEQTQYYSDRALEKCGEVKMVSDLKQILNTGDICYLAYTGHKEELQPVCEKLDKLKGICYSFYLNIYNGMYCLEIFSDKANKKNALIKLKKLLECEEVVVFGDNFNDLPMIELADRSYAPENALPEIKEKVTAVLEDCDHDGVAKFLKNEFSEN